MVLISPIFVSMVTTRFFNAVSSYSFGILGVSVKSLYEPLVATVARSSDLVNPSIEGTVISTDLSSATVCATPLTLIDSMTFSSPVEEPEPFFPSLPFVTS